MTSKLPPSDEKLLGYYAGAGQSSKSFLSSSCGDDEDLKLMGTSHSWPCRPITRATVVCVHAQPRRGVGTPNVVSSRASPTSVVTPSRRNRSISI